MRREERHAVGPWRRPRSPRSQRPAWRCRPSRRPATWCRAATRAWWWCRIAGTSRWRRASCTASSLASATSWTPGCCATATGAGRGGTSMGGGRFKPLAVSLSCCSYSLGGVPLAYSHVKIVGALGDIHDDQGSIHLHIEADFVVFTPQKGTKLVGVINKIVPSHIGCLIHGCFNASIPKHDCVSAEQQDLGLKIGDTLEFEVSRLDSDAAGMFFIWGRLTKDSLKSKCPETVTEDTNRNETKKKHKKNGTVNCEGDSNLGEVVDDADTAVREHAEEQNPDVVNGLSHKKTKKKKKHKQENQEPVLPGSDTSDYQSDHKKEKRKKRKYCEENHELSQLTEEPKATKRKKQHTD
uniref:DNA-directed RNA polymerase subunit n=1 Tax=Crocodylus porosus TaxID=8502 RepID=A0A7M4G0U1_CROPO